MSDRDVFQRLAVPFDASEIKQRSQGGRQLSYITARTARKRLNEVLGPENWECRVRPIEGGFLCSLSITLPSGRVVTREAVGGSPNMPTSEDAVKGGDSDAFKRAAVLFGVGEHLYGDDTAYVDHEPARQPSHERQREVVNGYADRRQQQRSGGNEQHGTPRNGRQLYAYVRKAEEGGDSGLLKRLNAWAKDQGLPYKMVEWDEDMTADAIRWLESQEAGSDG